MRPLLLASLVFATAAAAQPRLDAGRDPLTGEPVVFADAAPEADAPPESFGTIPLAHHAASGATKLVRYISDGDWTMYHDGADLVLGRTFLPVTGPPEIPRFDEIDRYRLPALPSDAVVVGSRVYVALRKNQGILILDATLTGWSLVGQITGPDALAVAVDGTTVYVGRGSAGVSAYDVSLPALPVLLGTVDTPGSANGLAVSGTLLAVADGNVSAGPDVRLYDVSTPGTFTPLGTAEMGGFATYAAFHAGRLYVTGDAGLRAFDVTDPSAPAVLGTASAGGETTYEVAFDGTTAFVAGLAGLRVVDVSAPAPVETGSWDGGGQYLSVAAWTAGFGFTPVADRFGGLQFVDTGSTPTGSTLVPNGGFPYRGVFAGGRLYVTSLGGGLRILSADGTTELGRIPTPPNTQEVFVIGDRAYVTDSNGAASGLTVVDVSDPAAPLVVGTTAVGASYGMATDAEQRTLFVASGFAGLRSYDLTGAAPALLDTYDVGANAVDVASDNDGGFGYVVSFGGGMTVLYIADPADLSLLDAEPGWGFLNAVEIDPSPVNRARVFAADGSAGLRLVDATNAAGIVTVSTTPTTTQARDVAARECNCSDVPSTNIYVAEDFTGLRRFNVSAGANEPVNVTGSFASIDRGIGVAVERFAGDGTGRVALMGGEAGVYLFDDFIVSADDAPGAPALAVESVSPNPARGTATVRYRLAGAGAATVEVLDLLGRRVAVAVGGATPGVHTAAVDVRALAAGLYVVRVAQNGTAVTARLAVAR